jgi:hypothetical protein
MHPMQLSIYLILSSRLWKADEKERNSSLKNISKSMNQQLLQISGQQETLKQDMEGVRMDLVDMKAQLATIIEKLTHDNMMEYNNEEY